nr:MAG: L2 protein [Neophocaena asiaeorientalis asiaeorientalis papillomavirus 2]
MVRAKRARRAAEGDLYSGCRRGQDCPDDIKRKFEHDTWADRFLKWFSSIIYLGNLGISTGRGSGGGTGYVPLGSGGRAVRPAMGGQPSRPTVPVETVGPSEVAPGGAVDASTPSVITPAEATVIVEGSPTLHEEIPLVPLHPEVLPVDPGPSGPLVPPGGPEDPPVLDVTSTYPHDPSLTLPGPRFDGVGEGMGAGEPLFPTLSLQPLDVSLLPGESSFPPHAVINLSGNFEEIELDVVGTGDPQTSTPISRPSSAWRSVRRPYTRRAGVLRRLYHRLTQQIKVQNPDFLQDPSRLVTYVFDNAAFQPDTTLYFPRPAEGVAQAPDVDFMDVGTLHKPVYSIEGQYVRVSRFGERETIRTRTGAAIGARVHFYTDLSTIGGLSDSSLGPDATDTGMELHLFGEGTGDTSIANARGGGVFLDNGSLHTESQFTAVSNGSLHSEYSDSMLLDTHSESFTDAHLALMNTDSTTQVMSIPQLARPVRGFAESTGGLSVEFPMETGISGSVTTAFINNGPHTPLFTLVYPGSGHAFYLHPSLLRLKRKKRVSY